MVRKEEKENFICWYCSFIFLYILYFSFNLTKENNFSLLIFPQSRHTLFSNVQYESQGIYWIDFWHYFADATRPSVMLSTSSPRVTKEAGFNVIVEFTKPVFNFDTSSIEVEGGTVSRQVHMQSLEIPYVYQTLLSAKLDFLQEDQWCFNMCMDWIFIRDEIRWKFFWLNLLMRTIKFFFFYLIIWLYAFLIFCFWFADSKSSQRLYTQ